MKRRIVLVAMMTLGAVLGVAHGKDKPKQSPLNVCLGNCNLQFLICDVNSGGKTWDPTPGEPEPPTLPPNPNGTAPGDGGSPPIEGPAANVDEGCKATYDSCVSTCKANFPTPNPNPA